MQQRWLSTQSFEGCELEITTMGAITMGITLAQVAVVTATIGRKNNLYARICLKSQQILEWSRMWYACTFHKPPTRYGIGQSTGKCLCIRLMLSRKNGFLRNYIWGEALHQILQTYTSLACQPLHSQKESLATLAYCVCAGFDFCDPLLAPISTGVNCKRKVCIYTLTWIMLY